MDTVIIENSWRQCFDRIGLQTFDDFYDYVDSETVGKNDRRTVQRLALGNAGDGKTLYMKRFDRPHFKDMLAATRQVGHPASQAGIEWRNARYLLNHGVDTYRPVCMGWRSRLGIELQSFFVSEELDGMCLLDFVIDRWHGLDRDVQDRIIVAMAALARRAHALNISLPDLQVWHFFIHPDNMAGACPLAVIDLHRMTQGVRSRRRKARDMSRLCWSMLAEYFDEGHKELLLSTYLQDLSQSQAETLISVIKRYETVLNNRHTAERYYRKQAALRSA
jgi:hypothetical protein